METPLTKKLSFGKIRLEFYVLAVAILIYIGFFIGAPSTFSGFNIYAALMSTIPFFGIMSLGMTFVIILGEMDLSFPSVFAFASLIFAKMFGLTGNLGLSILVCLAVGVLAGLFNAFLVLKIGIPSLVATIGTMFFFRGLVNVGAEGMGVSLVAAQKDVIFQLLVGRLFGIIPVQFIWFVGLGVFFWFLLERHKFGSHVLYVGDNKESARMMGINIFGVKTIVFMLMGLLAAFAGILSCLETTYFYPSTGKDLLLPALAPVFIGGTSVFGGTGTVIGTFIGVLIMGSLEAGIVAIGITGFWTQFIQGCIFLLGVALYAVILKKKS
jgi:simple sugar transport system permease protein